MDAGEGDGGKVQGSWEPDKWSCVFCLGTWGEGDCSILCPALTHLKIPTPQLRPGAQLAPRHRVRPQTTRSKRSRPPASPWARGVRCRAGEGAPCVSWAGVQACPPASGSASRWVGERPRGGVWQGVPVVPVDSFCHGPLSFVCLDAL